MKTIGRFIKDSRQKRKYSLKKVEAETRIKSTFIDYIEKENWQRLPDYAIVSGFVKSIAASLKADEKTALALLRRDYPPKELNVNPKADVENKFVWRPKLTFFLGLALITVLILGYLGIQYSRFVSPPQIFVSEPKEGAVVNSRELTVIGKTDSDATISVNNQPVIVDADGNFSTRIEISEKTSEIIIKAVSRAGRETVIHRKISPSL